MANYCRAVTKSLRGTNTYNQMVPVSEATLEDEMYTIELNHLY
jgi:hypothetical protein